MKIPLNKNLYLYMSKETAEEVRKTGRVPVSDAGTYLSVNENGEFDRGIYKDLNGNIPCERSDISNIFLRDTSPENIDSCLDLKLRGAEFFLSFSEYEIINRGFNVYKNPHPLAQNIYNIPIPENSVFFLDNKNIMKIKRG